MKEFIIWIEDADGSTRKGDSVYATTVGEAKVIYSDMWPTHKIVDVDYYPF